MTTSYAPDIRELWLSINKVATPIASLADEYLVFPGMPERFSQLRDVYSNLNTMGDALYGFLEMKTPTFGSKPEREFFMLANAAIENAKILLKIAENELRLRMAEKNA